jgi:hypothetical protein
LSTWVYAAARAAVQAEKGKCRNRICCGMQRLSVRCRVVHDSCVCFGCTRSRCNSIVCVYMVPVYAFASCCSWRFACQAKQATGGGGSKCVAINDQTPLCGHFSCYVLYHSPRHVCVFFTCCCHHRCLCRSVTGLILKSSECVSALHNYTAHGMCAGLIPSEADVDCGVWF